MEDKTDETLKMITEPLRKAMKEAGITNTLIAEQLKSLLTGDTISGKVNALQIIGKWAGLGNEKLHIVNEEIIVAGDEDLDEI